MSLFSFLRSKAEIDADIEDMREAINNDINHKINVLMGAQADHSPQGLRAAQGLLAAPPFTPLEKVVDKLNSEKYQKEQTKERREKLKNPKSIYKKRKPTHIKSASSF